MEISKLKKSGALIARGGWVKNIPFDGLAGVALKVRGAGNPDARRIRNELITELALPKGEAVSQEQADQIADQVITRAVLVDWNLVEDGEPVLCTAMNILSILQDPDAGELFRDAVMFAATSVGTTGEEALETDAKNSKTPSSGTSTGARKPKASAKQPAN